MIRMTLALLTAAAASIFYASLAYSNNDSKKSDVATVRDRWFNVLDNENRQTTIRLAKTWNIGCADKDCSTADTPQSGSPGIEMNPTGFIRFDSPSVAIASSFDPFAAFADVLDTTLALGAPESGDVDSLPTFQASEPAPAYGLLPTPTNQSQLYRGSDPAARVGHAGTVTPVPEPSILALILAGVGVTACLTRRRPAV